MTTVKYSLEDFTQDMESLLKSQPDDQKIFDTGSDWLEKLVKNPDSIPMEFRVPLGAGPRPNHASRLLYQGESGLQITAVVWGAGIELAGRQPPARRIQARPISPAGRSRLWERPTRSSSVILTCPPCR